MISTMNTANLPVFTPNQVLTDGDLNGVVKYLEGLNQLTRVYFIGMGIAYGLEVQQFSNPTTLQITPGCGITSEGFVIQWMPETTADPQNTFTHYLSTTIAANLFIPDAPSNQTYSIKELLPVALGQTGGTNVYPLTEAVLQQQVIVVLYDWQDVLRPATCQLNYDEQRGKKRDFRLRFFLLPATVQLEANASTPSAERLLQAGYQISQLPEPWKTLNAQYGTAAVFEARDRFLKEAKSAPQLRRFGYDGTDKSVDLTKISTYEAWRDNYLRICQTAIDAIGEAFPELFRVFSPFFSSFHPNSKQDFQDLKPLLVERLQHFQPTNADLAQPEPFYALQYFYDYLSQLVAAYVELVEAVFDLMDDSTPDLERFPRFLMLGQVGAIESSVYRSQFVQPRLYNNNQHRVQHVRHLYERLIKLCELKDQEATPTPADQRSFQVLPFYHSPIKITPSKARSTPLSEQAIPYYLNYPKLYSHWSYDASRKGRSDRHPAYFHLKQQNENSHVFEDLTYRLDAYTFYRIEGHMGRSNADALKGIQDSQNRYSLPFDVITLKLGDLESLKDLNLSAQLDQLNTRFVQLQSRFQNLWEANEQTWSSNVLLAALKQVFFDQPSLHAVNGDLMFNHFLYNAKIPERYEFAFQDSSDPSIKKCRLFLKNAAGTRIAQYIFRDRNQLLNFTGLTDEAIAKEQKRIVAGLIDSLTPNKIIYGIEQESPSLLRFYLRFRSTDQLSVLLDQGASAPETVPIELLSLNTFSVKEKPGLQIEEAGCPDVATLYGLLRDVSEDDPATADLKFKIGNRKAAQDIGSTELTQLIDAYNQQLEQWMSLHLFHNFAQRHPGMEPLGGVPKGGTFVLVYVDGEKVASLLANEQNRDLYEQRKAQVDLLQKAAVWLPLSTADQALATSWEELLKEIRNRKDIVIGDFCLPYRSSSSAPAVSYVLARPRPIVLLKKTVFCEGDPTSYPFILEPEGGTVKGEGVFFDGHQHSFQVSRISQSSRAELAKGNEVAITFSYAVDDTFDTLTVTVYPQPKPELTIQQGQTLCRDGSAIEIELAPATPENIELVSVTINGTETSTLKTNDYATTDQPQTITIEAQVRDRDTQCANTLTRTVTIHPLPQATLSIQDGQSFCQNAPPVQIALAPGTPTGVELVEVTINGTQIATLNPTYYARNDQSEDVAIVVRIRNQQSQCENTLHATVTIKPTPSAEFQIGAADKTSFLASDGSITLTPAQSGGTFQVQANGQDISHPVLENAEFFPDRVLLGEAETEKTVALTYRITEDGCSNELTRELTVSVRPAIEALFLLVIGPEGNLINRIELQEEQTFPLSFFTEHYQFEPQVSGKVSSVIFTYTNPDDLARVMAPVNTAPYRMPDRWQPTAGTHTIAAQPYSQPDGQGIAGESRAVKIMITTENETPEIAAPPEQGSSKAPRPPNPQGINSFLSRFTHTNDSTANTLSSLGGNLSIPVVHPVNHTLVPHLEPSSTAPLQVTPSYLAPVSPGVVAPKPIQLSQSVPTKLIQVATLSAIAVLLSLIWVHSGTKLPRTPQPSSSSNTEQPPP